MWLLLCAACGHIVARFLPTQIKHVTQHLPREVEKPLLGRPADRRHRHKPIHIPAPCPLLPGLSVLTDAFDKLYRLNRWPGPYEEETRHIHLDWREYAAGSLGLLARGFHGVELAFHGRFNVFLLVIVGRVLFTRLFYPVEDFGILSRRQRLLPSPIEVVSFQSTG